MSYSGSALAAIARKAKLVNPNPDSSIIQLEARDDRPNAGIIEIFSETDAIDMSIIIGTILNVIGANIIESFVKHHFLHDPLCNVA